MEAIDGGADVTEGLARTPEPPYWAVIFSSRRNAQPGDQYDETAQRMLSLAAEQPGYLGVEEAAEHIGITVSYWADEASIAAWRRDADHAFARVRRPHPLVRRVRDPGRTRRARAQLHP